jgi:hypothetical protein
MATNCGERGLCRVQAPPRTRRLLARLLAFGILLLLPALLGSQSQPSLDGQRTGALENAGLREAVSVTLGSGDTRYRLHRIGNVLSGTSGGLPVSFDASGVQVGTARTKLRLEYEGLFTGRRYLRGAEASPVSRGNRVTYRHGALTEWYLAGPFGLEQGFTVSHRPRHTSAGITLALGVSGSLLPHLARNGVVFAPAPGGPSVLRYDDLRVTDAAGDVLPARLGLAGRRLLISVDDRSARYPLTIDPFIQTGSKVVPSGSTGSFGEAIALSSDGSTALVGAGNDNGTAGAAYVFTRSGSTWTQQGKLVPSDPLNTGNTDFGQGVALSADGNTALIGAPSDSSGVAEGSAWVFTRSGGVWTQQSPELTPSNEFFGGFAEFGWSVSLSADGNTAVIGGPSDDSGTGAAWIYTRSGTTWAQGQKLTGAGETGAARFGYSVAISGDGATAFVGGPHDSSDSGAVWPFVLSGGTWTAQGAKLTGSDANASQELGAALALSDNGNTALAGGATIDSGFAQNGAAFVFTRSGSTWSQQGPRLTPSDGTGLANFGLGVALTGDGSTALIGAADNAVTGGAAWEFTRSGSTWTQQGSKLTGTGASSTAWFGYGVALSYDGTTAVVGGPEDASGNGAFWAFTASGVSVTAAMGGTSISADTSGGTFTGLTGPVLTETAPGLIGTGTVVLAAPAGFTFDAAGSPACAGTSGLTASVTAHTAATITCTVTAASSGSAGTLTFTGLTARPSAGTPLASGSITESGSASLPGASGGYGTLTEVAGAGAKLAFAAQPGGAARSATLAAPAVAIDDQFGNLSTSGAAVSLAITAGTGAAGASLSGTTTRSGPTAVFTGISIDKSGSGYTLRATSSGLTAATSTAFDVTGVGSLVFTTQPVGGAAGITAQPVVTARREDGTTETTSSAPISLAIKPGTGAAGAALNGTATVAAAAGVAAFSGLSVTLSGSGYILTASGSGTGVDSSPFDIAPGAAVPPPPVPANNGGGDTSTGTSASTTPTLLTARLLATTSGRNLTLSAASSIIPAGSATSYVFQLGTDGATSVTCPGQDSTVTAPVANAIDTVASVTVTTTTGATSTASTQIQMPAPTSLPTYSVAGTSFAATSVKRTLLAGTQLGQVQAPAFECAPPSGAPTTQGVSASVGSLATGDNGPTVQGSASGSCFDAVTVGIIQGIGCFTPVDGGHPLPNAEAYLLCKYQKSCATIGAAQDPPLFFVAHGGTTTTRAVQAASPDQLGVDAIYYSTQPVRVDGVEIDPVNGGAIVLARAGLVKSNFWERDAAYLISSDAVVKVAGLPVSLHVPDYGAALTQAQSDASCGKSLLTGDTGCLNSIQVPGVPDLSNLAPTVDGPVEIAVSPEHAGIELGQFSVPKNLLPVPWLPSLPLTGTLTVNLESAASAQVSAYVELPDLLSDGNGHGLSGSTILTIDNQKGLDLDYLQVTVPSLAQLGLARLKNLQFTYAKATSLFDGKGTLDLSDEIQGLINLEIAFEHGDFQKAHVDYTAIQGGGYPLGGGAFLTYAGADLTLNPTTVAGDVKISVGPALTATGCGIMGVDGTGTFSFGNPVTIDLKGQSEILCAPFGYSENFHADTDGDVGYGVGIDYPIPGIGSVKGSLYGQAYADLNNGTFHFQIDGGVTAHIGVQECGFGQCVDASINGSATATWSDKGAGVCAHIDVPVLGGFDVGAGIDNLQQIVEESAASGGTLTEAALLQNFHLFASDCNVSRWQTLKPPAGLTAGLLERAGAAAHRSTTYGLHVTPGEPMAEIGLQGRGGAPAVTITEPDGKVVTPPVETGLSTYQGMLIVRQPTSGETLVEIPHPAPGDWVVGAASGSAPITKAQSTTPLPAPRISGTVSGNGTQRVLHYSVERQPGLEVDFLEGTGKGARKLGTASAANGSLAFTTAATPGRHAIAALLVRNGIPASRTVIAHFDVIAPRIGRPHDVRAAKTRAGWRIAFAPAANATEHLLTVRFADGAQMLFAVVGKKHTFTVRPKIDSTPPVAIQVVGLSGSRRGPAVLVTARRSR